MQNKLGGWGGSLSHEGVLLCGRCRRGRLGTKRVLRTRNLPPDPAGLFSEGGEVIKLHIEGSLTIPITIETLKRAQELGPDWAVCDDVIDELCCVIILSR